MMDDRVSVSGVYRGVDLHAGQPATRLGVVKHDIDRAHDLSSLGELVAFADSPVNAPEARLLAQAKALATLDHLTETRAPRARRPQLSRQRIRASCAGLASRRWQSPTHYCSLLDVPPGPGHRKPAPRVAR